MDNEYVLVTDDGELIHSGKKGMKWGRRLYQNEDGSLTPLGRIHYGIGQAQKAAKNKAAQKKRAATLEAKKKTAAEAKAKEDEAKAAEEALTKKKADLLQNPTAKDIYENRHLFTYQELNAAKMRIEMERSIKNLEPAPVDKGKEFTDGLIKTADTVANVANSGSKAYNALAKIYNSLYGKKNDASLPMIDDRVVTSLDKFKEETDWINAKNARKNALDAAKEKVKSELEQYKEETEWKKAMNERAKAEEDGKPKEQSDLEKLREQNAMADAENKRREIERASREHDRKDQKERERDKAEADRKEAEARARAEDKARKEYEKGREEYEKSRQSKSDTTYRKSGGDREYVDPNTPRGLAVRDPAGTGLSATAASRGKSYTEKSSGMNTSVNLASKIASMTASGNKTYAEIASQLGVSTSTVATYFKGRESANNWISQHGEIVLTQGPDGKYYYDPN